MWIRHWAKRRKKEGRYLAFVARYHEFRPEDCVDICRDHHREIHVLYLKTIGQTARRLGPCAEWSWIMAREMMDQLRLECERWLRTA